MACDEHPVGRTDAARPKIVEALAVWSRWPHEVEASLLTQYGPEFNIKHWHRLTLDTEGCPVLSSRLMLVLLEGLNEDSWFKTVAERDGDWTEAMRIAADTYAEVTNVAVEVSKVVGVLVAAYGGGEYDEMRAPKFYPSPRERRELPAAPELVEPDEIYMGLPE